jgi:hypothetical protein
MFMIDGKFVVWATSLTVKRAGRTKSGAAWPGMASYVERSVSVSGWIGVRGRLMVTELKTKELTRTSTLGEAWETRGFLTLNEIVADVPAVETTAAVTFKLSDSWTHKALVPYRPSRPPPPLAGPPPPDDDDDDVFEEEEEWFDEEPGLLGRATSGIGHGAAEDEEHESTVAPANPEMVTPTPGTMSTFTAIVTVMVFKAHG